MNDVTSDTAETGNARSFNFNKLQAVICIASSAAVSIAITYWVIQKLF